MNDFKLGFSFVSTDNANQLCGPLQRKIWTWTKNEKFELNINYDLDLGCFRGMDNREIISWRLRSVRNYDTQQEVQDFSDFSS